MAPPEVPSESVAVSKETGDEDNMVSGPGAEQAQATDASSTATPTPISLDEEGAILVRKTLEKAATSGQDESLQEVRAETQSALMYEQAHRMLKEERTRGDLAARSMQAVLHHTYTDARIHDLEVKLWRLEEDVRDLPENFKLHKKKLQCPIYKPVIKRSLADEFRTTELTRNLAVDQKPALEVLVSENYQQTKRAAAAAAAAAVDVGPSDEPKRIVRRATGTLGQEISRDPKQWVPERLRIRSWCLIGHLERVCHETLSTHRTFDVDFIDASPVVLLRPFKLLFKYEDLIRESVSDVERRIEETEGSEEKSDIGKGIFSDIEFKWKDLLRDLKLLIEFLDVDLASTFELRKSIQDGTATDIDYNDLWHLFDLGDTVVAKGKREQAYRVINYAGGREPLVHIMENERDRVPPIHGFAVDCCSLRFNGVDYVPNLHTFTIRRYLGRRPISSLDVYPLRLDPDADALREALSAQGRYYLESTRQPYYHRMHRGRTLDEPPQDLEGQVIVDIAMALNAEPDWVPTSDINPDALTQNDLRETHLPPWCGHGLWSEACCGSDTVFKDLQMASYLSHPFLRDYGGLSGPRTADELGDDMILLPNWVHGFILRLRKWATLKLDDLTEVPFDNDFDELMISPIHKQTILALVDTHEKSRANPFSTTQSIGSSLDLVKGKGTGLILLLHGEPGVGKTSTAECVADKTKRPLFPITCGDIGETAMEVETNLQQNFRLAHRWDSVLLLDEADVFLAKRNKTDLRRNAVTSVFLRSLDYYAGILFLTTNRVGGIDPAFKSRIHLSVYYPRLDLDTTIKLYSAFLRRAKEEQAKAEGPPTFKIREKEILKFAERHYRQTKKEGNSTWNGRQIRNAFQTAIALIEYEAAQLPAGAPKPLLSKAHFKAVAEGSKQFDIYLRRTLQGADDEIAKKDQWRDDYFDMEEADEVPVSLSRKATLGGGGGGKNKHGGGARSAGSRTSGLGGSRREAVSYSDSLISESESESEEDSDEDDDEDDEEEEVKKGSAAGKDLPAAKEKGGKGKKTDAKASAAVDAEEIDDDYAEFLKLKALMRAKNKS